MQKNLIELFLTINLLINRYFPQPHY